MKKRILVTAALPYANGPLHFGHIAGAYLPADCYSRFQRLLGNDVLYICGSDEYGIAISLSAEMANRTPKEHIDIFHNINKEFFKKLNMSFDHYSRTTCPQHIPIVQKFFLDLYENGYIEEKEEEHLFSEEENKFLADRYVVGTCPKCSFENARGDECQKCGGSYEATDLLSPRSKLTNSKLILKRSRHWYLRFDKFKKKLNEWLSAKEWKPNVMHFTKQFLKDLKERAITRDSSWGVPVPLEDAKGKVLYVWFDAPIGYISATMEWAEKINDKDKWKDYWLDKNTKLINFIGKDNIPFHTIFFPAMIMGQNEGYILAHDVPANEFLMLENRQFSKSDNWYIDLDDFFKKYTADQIRYYLAAIAPETSDSDFSWKDFQNRCNSELLAKLGNFVHRTLVFAKNNCSQKVPKPNLEEEDNHFLLKIKELSLSAIEAYYNYHLRLASQIIMELAHLGNCYFDQKKPWKLAKDPATHEQMDTTIFCCLECIKAIAMTSSPIIPDSSQKIWEMLGYTSKLEDEKWDDVLSKSINENQGLKDPVVLFRKIEDEEIEKELEKLKNISKV